MSQTIKITETAEVALPFYVKKGEGRYAAVMSQVEGRKDRFNEVQVSHSMIATYGHMDTVAALREIMDGVQVEREEFMASFLAAQERIQNAVNP